MKEAAGEEEISDLYRTCVEKLKWHPDQVNRLTFAQLIAFGGQADGKIHSESGTVGEIMAHIEAYREREKPENALPEAEQMLAEEYERWALRRGR